MNEGRRLHVTGVVQGVGFRPFVYGLAARYGLSGWVCNNTEGVDMEICGEPPHLDAFCHALQAEAPPLAHIETVTWQACPENGSHRFEIRPSGAATGGDQWQPVAADAALCDECRRELFDPTDRRYRYPFINCTNCGPRYTIIRAMPYDRPATTMGSFALCAACAVEYGDPLDRRFHAQPVACPQCGPQLWLERRDKKGVWQATAQREEALQAARDLLAQGAVLALKGLGGFQLACDAGNATAVAALRRAKQRPHKPLALMMVDMAAVRRHCHVSAAAEELLRSRERPIVLLPARSGSPLQASCAPGQRTLGVMLPYTPLHTLLIERAGAFPEVLVMTSGNAHGEPLAIDNDEARRELGPLADALLLHDRPIEARCDDSVVQVVEARDEPALYPVRRARGYAPQAVLLPQQVFLPQAAPDILAVGAELKNTFCLTRGRQAILSPHVGNLNNMATLSAFEQGVAHMEKLFGARPRLLAHDLHPDYLGTRYALARAEAEGLPAIGVQHHHAHIAAVMAEHSLDGAQPVLGVAFDGAGYGTDGAIWGGEFFTATYEGFERMFHLTPVPLPGGDLAVRQPWRMALSWLRAAGLSWDEALPAVQYGCAQRVQGIEALPVLAQQLARGLNCPLTTSMGRLFDAVAALVGVRQAVTYEGQAAIELEALVDARLEDAYRFCVDGSQVNPAPLLEAIVADLRRGVQREVIAARFHNAVAHMVVDVCRRMRLETRLETVALSGGVWQNVTLLRKARRALEAEDFEVLVHRRVPANDGGLALGQAVIAAWTASQPRGQEETDHVSWRTG